MIVIIDNYDSFTYNLYQYIGEIYTDISVFKNDEISIDELKKLPIDCIILSPGPGRPEESGITLDVIDAFKSSCPILGVCLGHQSIGQAFGGNIVSAKEIMHGKTSFINHNDLEIFSAIPSQFEVMRYHSLVIKKDSIPDDLVVVATSTDDDEIMAIKHKDLPIYGVQFHPESIGTEYGKQIIRNFLDIANKYKGVTQ